MKNAIIVTLIMIFSEPLFGQSNTFEGKLIYEILTQSNERFESTFYFKKDKLAYTSSQGGGILSIINCQEQWTFVKAKVSNSATYVSTKAGAISKLTTYDEFTKTDGLNCQRVSFVIKPNPEVDMEMHVNGFMTKDIIAYNGCENLGFTMVQYTVKTVSSFYNGEDKYTLKSLHPENIADSIFVPVIDNNMQVTDIRGGSLKSPGGIAPPEDFTKFKDFELMDNGELYSRGRKIAIVRKTKVANPLSGFMGEFIVYDLREIPYMKFEGEEGKMMFLDDNKSYLPRVCDAYLKKVAQFIASDSIFTERGFNKSYRSAYIERYGGFNASKIAGSVRDKKAPITYIETNIFQSDMPIGRYILLNDSDCQILNTEGKVVAVVKIIGPNAANSDIHSATIYLDPDKPAVKKIESYQRVDQLREEAVQWLVNNGYL